MPITWRNVDPTDTRGALLGMNAANQSFNAGFDKIGEVLKQREQMASDNWNQQKINNTNAYMDALGEAKTPEELQAKQAILAQMRQGMGAQVDAAAVRAAEDARLPLLQQRAKAGIEYKNYMTDEDQAKVRDQVGVLIAQGKTKEAMDLAQSVGLRQMAPVMAAGNAEERLRTELQYKANEEARKAKDQEYQDKLFPGQITLQEQQIANQKAEAALRSAQATELATRDKKESEAETKLQRDERVALRDKVAQGGVFSLGEATSREGAKAIDDHLTSKLTNPDDIGRIQGELSNLLSQPIVGEDGKTIPIPTSYVIDGIRSMGEAGWTGRWGNQFSDKVRARVLRDQRRILQDRADLVKLDFTDDMRSRYTSEKPSDLIPPPEKETPANAPTTALDTAAKKVVSPAKEEDPQVAAIAAARKTLKDDFIATQADIRKVGGIDNITEAQRTELKRIQAASALLDEQEAKLTTNFDATLSERRRKADQEEARKNSLGR